MEGSGSGPAVADISLVHGWLPLAIQLLAALALVVVLVRSGRRWWTLWVPIAVVAGGATAAAVYALVDAEGVLTDPAPPALWAWAGLSAGALVALVAGWRTRWWRRISSVVAIPLALASVLVVLNAWVGYLPSVGDAWDQATAAPLPDQIDPAALATAGPMPSHGSLVSVTTPSTGSGFGHRPELVYLPPAWFTGHGRARLPVVLMIGGELAQPSDWPRTGRAVRTADAYASTHHGLAPVLVFADASGSFSTDTECVNGTRGRAADHLTNDVRPYVVSAFGLSPSSRRWGVAGFSTGGTCAIDLAVMHPELFSAFDDIEGDLAPNSGNRSQTIQRLFGGDAAAYDAFDPATVMARHGAYAGLTGRFDESDGHTRSGAAVSTLPLIAASQLAADARHVGIGSEVAARPGAHNWQFAAQALHDAMPWMTTRLAGTSPPTAPSTG